MLFQNRQDAGRKLVEKLQHYRKRKDTVVLALPRGGVPVAYEIAQELKLPLDIFVVRKLGLPEQKELAIGAIASGSVFVLNDDLIAELKVSNETIVQVVREELAELKRREALYRHGGKQLKLENKCVIIVDDGLATGASMRAAVVAIRKQQPKKITIAVPVSAKDTYDHLKKEVDEIRCISIPSSLSSVGSWYVDFSQTTDIEVQILLNQAAQAWKAA